jgi:hypothetical protein
MSELSNTISNIEESAQALRIIGPALESTVIRQRIAFTSIIDLVDGCELNGDSGEELRASVVNVLQAIKAVAENGMQKGPAQ